MLDFWKVEYLTAGREDMRQMCQLPVSFTVPNFAVISQTVAQIWQFSIFVTAAAPTAILDF